jgi:hypothetical protein
MSKSVIKFVAIALTAAILSVVTALLPVPVIDSQSPDHLPLTPGVVMAQSPPRVNRSEQEWQRVYELMPDLPRENQYIDRVTGAPVPNSTLVTRLIHYHLFIKSRAPNYRLDWKLTLADYLDANEWISPSLYSSADTLQPNPLNGDKAAIGGLNRAQRDQLVTALVSIFSGNSPSSDSTSGNSTSAPSGDRPSSNTISPVQSVAPSPSSSPAPVQTQPGAAQLLLP